MQTKKEKLKLLADKWNGKYGTESNIETNLTEDLRAGDDDWVNFDGGGKFYLYIDKNEFRLKPQPKLRPFKDEKEFSPCMNKQILYPNNDRISNILECCHAGIYVCSGGLITFLGYRYLFDVIKRFTDDTPCGILE